MWEAVDGEDLLAAGQLTTAAGTPAARVARLGRATGTWAALGQGLHEGLGAPTSTGTSSAGRWPSGADGLWVGGTFTSAGDVPSVDLARWGGAGTDCRR